MRSGLRHLVSIDNCFHVSGANRENYELNIFYYEDGLVLNVKYDMHIHNIHMG